jgi:hypothetical protein
LPVDRQLHYLQCPHDLAPISVEPCCVKRVVWGIDGSLRLISLLLILIAVCSKNGNKSVAVSFFITFLLPQCSKNITLLICIWIVVSLFSVEGTIFWRGLHY